MPLCLRVDKRLGQHALVKLREINLINTSFRIQTLNDYLLIPVHRQPSEDEARLLSETGVNVQLTVADVPKARAQPSLLEALGVNVPTCLQNLLPHSVDVVGDIAVVEVAPQLWDYREALGGAILAVNPRVQTVLAKVGAVGGVYRVRDLRVIAGVDRTETVHREYGCSFNVDLSKAYFSPRLGFEHNRVASQVAGSETVIDLFTGVGPFAIHIAKRLKTGKVYAIDVNPSAIAYLKKNIAVNHVEGRVVIVEGDARRVVEERLSGVAHRVIMNLPLEAFKFLDTACLALRNEGGIVHYYAFTSEAEPLGIVRENVVKAIRDTRRSSVEVLGSRVVKATAPHEHQVALDIKVA